MKKVLNAVVGKQQTAFIPGSKILDGILLMQELVAGYHQKSGSSRCAIRIDIMKVFDSVNWEFLWTVLHILNFSPIFVNWIRACVSRAWFLICFNGTSISYFPSSRGLRQGDPLSPYLFIVVMDSFNELMKYESRSTDFIFHPKCKDFDITTVFFADDMFVVYGAQRKTVQIVSNALKEFGDLSGVIAKIGEIVRTFLWKGETQWNYLAKMKWKNVTHSREAGGLRVKGLRDWNKVCMASHIWDICNMKEGNISGAWLQKSTDSSIWRQLLKYKEVIREHVKVRIGDGVRDNFMYDSWLYRGYLNEVLSEVAKRFLRIEDKATVAKVMTSGRWPKGTELTVELKQLKENLSVLKVDKKDRLTWGGGGDCIRTKDIWKTLHPVISKPEWVKLVWFKENIPRHIFLCWVLFQGKLPIKDRLKRWDVCDDDLCLFYGEQESVYGGIYWCIWMISGDLGGEKRKGG
ncbi:hypothetical protein LIER_16283 [Lithospermum erythrorhizon]|uniref:Reverse transcriptase domain-containing protein n=1 Tax=Lithospermum erythrorhizon TaxID=34254 RepID=A0AAV3QA97_LITER